MEVDMEEAVENIISKLEDDLGQDNLYKLIYAGKLLKEENPLSDYNIINKIPIIVMVTKLKDTAGSGSSKIESNVPNPEQKTGNHLDTESYEFPSLKRTRTVTEDSGFEDDFDTNHFITDAELHNVIEVIQNCEYLGRKGEPVVTLQQIETILAKFCENEDMKNIDFEEAVLDKIDDILRAKLNKSQIIALLEDVQSIFEEPRETLKNVTHSFDELEDLSSDESELEEDSKLSRLTDMGFSKASAENALKASSNNLQGAVEILVPTTENENTTSSPSPSSSIKSNPLSFLRDIEEFQFLRYLVLQDPMQLQPLLLSFGQSHPDIMKIINLNKDIFVSMLHEQTGAKLHGRH